MKEIYENIIWLSNNFDKTVKISYEGKFDEIYTKNNHLYSNVHLSKKIFDYNDYTSIYTREITLEKLLIIKYNPINDELVKNFSHIFFDNLAKHKMFITSDKIKTIFQPPFNELYSDYKKTFKYDLY